ncbi:hypothetical protein QJS10_CPB21g00119 [Acorus calamus]|uniref:Glutamine amidotransferase type-2 domain-containing protein n=1 Tax=Acorus calamus TaxID=4465 RepID=A0AAV9C544_ACOCL|nr:hypothetical protein QJS10_CPB21g00119 [Acorus calamus]
MTICGWFLSILACHPANSTFSYDDKPREQCGVVGIFAVASPDGSIRSITGLGLVSDVISDPSHLPGSSAIGHPFVAGYLFGSVAVAHNGNFTNYASLRSRLEEMGSIFNTTSDTEVGYAEKLGVDYRQGLIRSHYVGRTFIQPTQAIRDLGVRLKLAPVRGLLEGKRVVVVDDSIVRGTTSSKIVRLISNKMSDVEGVRGYIGADSLAFLSLESLRRVVGAGKDGEGFCDACLSRNYPVPPRDD